MFLNIVLDEAVEEKEGGEKVRLGMVVSFSYVYNHSPALMANISVRPFEETR